MDLKLVETTVASSVKIQSKSGSGRQMKQGRFQENTLSPEVINELVDGSSRIIDEILKELDVLIKSEADPTRNQTRISSPIPS